MANFIIEGTNKNYADTMHLEHQGENHINTTFDSKIVDDKIPIKSEFLLNDYIFQHKMDLDIKTEEIDIKEELFLTSPNHKSNQNEVNSNLPLPLIAHSYKCNICYLRCYNKQNLAIHTRIHANETRFQCNICHLRTTTMEHLKIHVREHTGEKHFDCDICNVRFKQIRALVKHKRAHTYNKCDICHKRFTQSDKPALHKCKKQSKK